MKNQGTTIDFTKAIVSGIIGFEEACALQGVGMTDAIREGIIDFETACMLQGLAIESGDVVEAYQPKPKRKTAKKQQPKAEEPKAEAPEPKEAVYTKGGLLLQWNDDIAAKGAEKATITKGYNALTKQGFTVTKKRVGTYVYLYHAKDGEKSTKGNPVYIDGKTSKEFAAAKLDSGWVMIKGGWAYPDLLKSYDDCFRPEQ